MRENPGDQLNWEHKMGDFSFWIFFLFLILEKPKSDSDSVPILDGKIVWFGFFSPPEESVGSMEDSLKVKFAINA